MTRTPRPTVCTICYLDGIERLCRGYTFTAQGSTTAYAVPPLPPAVAIWVRRAARIYLAGLSESAKAATAQHPWHYGQPPAADCTENDEQEITT